MSIEVDRIQLLVLFLVYILLVELVIVNICHLASYSLISGSGTFHLTYSDMCTVKEPPRHCDEDCQISMVSNITKIAEERGLSVVIIGGDLE